MLLARRRRTIPASSTRAATIRRRSARRCGTAPTNETLAKLADWFIGVPLTVVLILLVAWLVARLGAPARPQGGVPARRRRPRRGDQALQTVGLRASTVDAVDDPRRVGPGDVDLDGRRVDRHAC